MLRREEDTKPAPEQENFKVVELRRRRCVLIAYLRLKTDEQDWHGVSDAANDIRVLEAQIVCIGGTL